MVFQQQKSLLQLLHPYGFLQYGSCQIFANKLAILSNFPKTVFVKLKQQRFCYSFCTLMVFLQYGSCQIFANKLAILSHFPKKFLWFFSTRSLCYNFCTHVVFFQYGKPSNWPFFHTIYKSFCGASASNSLNFLLNFM